MYNSKIKLASLVFLFSVLNSIVVLSQERNSNRSMTIGMDMVQIFHPRTPAYSMSLEYKLDDRYALRAIVGVMRDDFRDKRVRVSKFQGYQVGLGGRYYFYNREIEKTYAMFFDSRLLFKRHTPTVHGDFDMLDDFGAYEKRILYQANITDAHLQTGFGQRFRLNRFRLDLIVGRGFMHRWVNYDYPDTATFKTNGSPSEDRIFRPGTSYSPKLSDLGWLEFTLGYAF